MSKRVDFEMILGYFTDKAVIIEAKSFLSSKGKVVRIQDIKIQSE